ncbi:carboxylesterase family protein [Streptomyces specialis]|uniref:carboxylesterase family protein n=1 Tax=Streptomyces specialis TaxID=498367 RepID=UPI00073E81C7|nr:carboxylesterase family protein [Streptomyces specialis]
MLLWVHGGGYQSGSGTDMAGDGAAFARDHGLVVVTFNYRLGALGFLAVEGEEHTGAHGLHDQAAALRWVRENIAGSGGDPDRITVYGLSAGAKAVANPLASPLPRGMIHRAASSSGGADHVAPPEQAARLARRLLRHLGTTPDRLRAVPATDILAAQTAIGSGLRASWIWRPAIDGLALTTHPLRAIAAGSAAGVPLLAQSCADESALYQLAVPDADEQTDRVLTEYFGPTGRDEILAAYAAPRPDPTALRLAVMSDERYGVPTTRLADAQSAHAPVWRSRYDGPFTGLAPGFDFLAGQLHAAHGSDGTAIWQGGTGLAALLHEAFGAFATGHPPAADGLPDWPGYMTGARTTMILTPDDPHPADDPGRAEREAWTGRNWQSGTWWQFDGI